MRNLKKVLALVIAFSMMLSVVAFAGYADVDADADYASAVELTSALGIFQGDESGNFNADKTITRAEMAAVIIRMQGLDAAAKASAGATQFADVAADHWASGYVNLASQNGIIKGTGDGNFAPNDTLTYEAAVAMIVRALGFEPVAEQKGGWTAGYVAVANSNKVTEGAAATATRGNLAVLVANAMNTPMMDQTSYGSDEKYEVLNGKGDKEYRSLLTDRDIYVVDGIIGDKDVDKVAFKVYEDSADKEFKVTKNEAGTLQFGENFVIGNSNALAYKDQQVTAYVQKDGRNYVILAVVPSNVGDTLTILSDDVVGYENNEVEYYIDAANSSKTKDIKVAADIPVEFNKGARDLTLEQAIAITDVELVFIENTGDTTFDKVIATQYVSDIVDYVDADRDKLTLKENGTITFDFEDEEKVITFVDDKGAEISLEDLAEGDVVALVADNTRPARFDEYIQVIKLANSVIEGAVDETFTSNDGDEYVVIGGQEYPLAVADEIQAGDEGLFYIGLTGKVIYFDGSLAGENYAYILEGAIAQGAFTQDQWQLKLLTEEGVETFDIRKNSHEAIADYINDNFDAEMSDDKTKFLFDDRRADKDNAARLVTYKLDGNGEIKELAAADVKKTFAKENDEYREDAQRLGNVNLEEDTIIFNVAGKDAKDAYATDISYLIDEAAYTGFAAQNKDDEYAVVVITDLESTFAEDTGFAVVTKMSKGKTEEGEEVTKVTYVQDEEEGVVTFDDDSEIKNAANIALNVGDVFLFNAANGIVLDYIVIAELDENNDFVIADDFLDEDGDINNDEVKKLLGEDSALVVGYNYSTKREATSKGQKIEVVPGDVLVIPGLAYKYTYNATLRNPAIELADFMVDADYLTVEVEKKAGKEYNVTYASPMLVRLVNDVVIDAYGTTARVEIDREEVVVEEDAE